MLRYIPAWFFMMVIAIINGILREKLMAPRMRELAAHQLSTLTLVILFGLYFLGLFRIWPLASGGAAVAVGLIWLCMTVAFESGFGHYVAGHSWKRLLKDYDLRAGRVWIVILIWVAAAPCLFFFWL
jgi:hypothetical protein